MDAIKPFLLFFIFIPIFGIGQETKYPKDTIYVKYENKIGPKKWNAKFKRDYNGKAGIYFNIENKSGDMALFYSYEQKTDTLCIKHLEDYKLSNLKEINSKEWSWYKKKFGGQPPFGNKNGVFVTYLLEVISKDYFVMYPVIWRNEGAID